MFDFESTRSASGFGAFPSLVSRLGGMVLSFCLIAATLLPASALAVEGEPIYADDRITAVADETPDAWDFFEQVPNGYGADAIKVLDLSPLKEYTHRGSETDATSLKNMQASIQWLKKCNELRTQNNLDPLQVNYTLVAIAMTDANWSLVHDQDGHANVFNAGENLAWGHTDPFSGWYDQEKAYYDAGDREPSKVGHYLNIINPKFASADTMVYGNTGFATVEGGSYGIEHCQTFGSTSSSWSPGLGKTLPAGLTFGDATRYGNLSVEDYEKQLNAFAEGGDYTPDYGSGIDGDTGGDGGIGTGITANRPTASSADSSTGTGIDSSAPYNMSASVQSTGDVRSHIVPGAFALMVLGGAAVALRSVRERRRHRS